MSGAGAAGAGERKRWVPSDSAKALLETIFSADSFPTFSVRTQLARQLGVDARQIQIWFQVLVCAAPDLPPPCPFPHSCLTAVNPVPRSLLSPEPKAAREAKGGQAPL